MSTDGYENILESRQISSLKPSSEIGAGEN